MRRKKTIMVVDDADSIRRSLADILRDEGYDVVLAQDGQEAMEKFEVSPPDLVFLDIWMPGMDGTEILKEIKAGWPDVQVIMISGHGNIETAVKTTKLGAYDYIEKPLSLEGILLAVRRALHEGEAHEKDGRITAVNREGNDGEPQASKASKRNKRGTKTPFIPQQTIKKSIVMGGQGLHSGMQTGLILSPLPPDSGIIFTELSSEEMVPAYLDYVYSTDYSTTIKSGHTSIMTIEHLMAVLHIYRITNLLIKTGGELPILDGSATTFCRMLEDSGIDVQDKATGEIVIDNEYLIGDTDGRYIAIAPSQDLTVYYSMEYPPPIGKQEIRVDIDSPEVFKQEIAPARTYGFLKDYERLEEMGLAKGGRLSNVILVDDEKIINTALRFTNEFARHKVLDILGDLYLLGRPIRGAVSGYMTGHTENIALLRKISKCVKR